MLSLNNPDAGEDRIEVYATLPEARAQFGENYDGLVFQLTRAQVEALVQGGVVAFDIRGREYAGFLMLKETSPDAHSHH